MAIPSYFFTLFKKFQILGHVPEGINHGAGVGGFNLNNPAAVFGNSGTGALLGASTNPAESPLWAVLNSRAMDNPAFEPVFVAGNSWPTMPAGSPPEWLEFQVDAPDPKLVEVFADWIVAGKVNDIPADVLAAMPAANTKPRGGPSLFVCNLPDDNGIVPVPDNYWATALIFLTDPMNGAIVNPGQLASSSEYYVTAIVGNAGASGAGRYVEDGGVKIESEARVMVWNTGFSPAVRLPALSNLDITAKQPVYEVYALNAGSYEVVGFRLPVQTAFDGLTKAIEDAKVDLGGLTAEEWIHDKNAHLCTRVMIRHVDQGWPAPDESPLENRRVAQRNLAPFAVDLTVDQPDPNIEWTHFMLGEAGRAPKGDPRLGGHTLSIDERLRGEGFAVYLALPRRSFERYVDWRKSRGFERVETAPAGPFADSVVLRVSSPKNALVIRPLEESGFLAASLGIEYSASQMKQGNAGSVSVTQRTTRALLDPSAGTYKVQTTIDGGFTLEVAATGHVPTSES